MGEVAEWSNAPVSKTGIPQGIGSSNLPLSAFGSPKRTYGVTKSASRFAKATFAKIILCIMFIH